MVSSTPQPQPDPESLLQRLEWVRLLVRSVIGDISAPHDALELTDEITQQTAIALWRTPPQQPGALRGWIRTVSRNALWRMRRDSATRVRHEQHAAQLESSHEADLLELAETQQQVVTAVLQLADPYRRTILELYFEGLTPQQIADREGIPSSTVRMRCKRALQRLREVLQARDETGERRWSSGLLLLAASTPPRATTSTPPSDSGTLSGATTHGASAPSSSSRFATLAALGGITMTTKNLLTASGVVALLAMCVWITWGPNTRSSRNADEQQAAMTSSGSTPDRATTDAPRESSLLPAATTPRNSATRVVEGVVVDAFSGEPVDAAQVTLSSVSVGVESETQSVRSAHDGRFEIDMSTTDVTHSLMLKVQHPRYVTHGERLTDWRDMPRIELVTGVELSGRVITETGEPVTRGAVYPITALQQEAGQPTQGRPQTQLQVPLDHQGRFRIMLAEDRVLLVAVGEGIAAAHTPPLELSRDGHDEIEIVARPSGVLQVVVTDAAGAAVVGASVVATHELEGTPIHDQVEPLGWQSTGLTDANGALQRGNNPGPISRLNVWHRDYAPYSAYDTRIDTRGVVPVVLQQGRWLVGELRPIPEKSQEAGVAVKIGAQILDCECTPDGRFRSRAFDPSVDRATLIYRGFDPVPLQFEGGRGACDVGIVEFTQGSSLQLKITTRDGQPVVGAKVSARKQPLDFRSFENSTDVSDDSGEALLSGLPDGLLRVVVSHSQSSVWTQDIRISEVEGVLPVELEPAASVTLRVVDDLGEPVMGVLVSLDRQDRELALLMAGHSKNSISDPLGRVKLELPLGRSIPLLLAKSNWQPLTISVDPLGAGEMRDLGDFVVTPGVTVSGRVTTPQGRPIAGAVVSVKRRFGQQRGVAVSDRSGEFAIGGFSQRDVVLRCFKPGYGVYEHSVAIRGEGSTQELAITLRPAAARSVRIVDSQFNPLPHTAVMLADKIGTPALRLWTDGAGSIELHPVVAGAFELSVVENRQSLFRAEYESLAEVPTEIVLAETATLILELSSERVGASSLRYRLHATDNRSRSVANDIVANPGAEVRIERVPTGDYRLHVTSDGHNPFERSVTLEANQETRIYVSSRSTRSVRLRVLASNRLPVEGAEIIGVGVLPLTTDASGTAAVDVATTKDELTITVRALGHALKTLKIPVDTQDGTEYQVELQPEAWVDVRIVSADGQGVEGVSLTVLQRNNKEPRPHPFARDRVRTDTRGNAQLHHLSGEVSILASSEGTVLPRKDLQLVPGRNELEWVIQNFPTVPVSGSVRVNGDRVKFGQLTFTTAERGRTTLEVSSDGSFQGHVSATAQRVQYRAPSDKLDGPTVEVTIPADGGQLALEFRSFTLHGRVVDAEGNPVPNSNGVLLSAAAFSSFETDAEGRFNLPGLQSGTWLWSIAGRKGALQVEVVEGEELLLQLPAETK